MVQNEFVTVSEVIERIKDIICHQCEASPKLVDVAIVLGMGKMNLSSMKSRNSISGVLPHIIRYCKRDGIDPIKLLF